MLTALCGLLSLSPALHIRQQLIWSRCLVVNNVLATLIDYASHVVNWHIPNHVILPGRIIARLATGGYFGTVTFAPQEGRSTCGSTLNPVNVTHS